MCPAGTTRTIRNLGRVGPVCHDRGIERLAATPDVGFVGLDEDEAHRRAEEGRANVAGEDTSRSVASILKANIVTRFNALLGSLLVVILVVGPPQDALFGIVLVGNTVVGIVQELRAKRTLDRLVVVGRATATVIRSGSPRAIPSAQVVEGDLLEVRRGDQIVVDGPVVAADGLEVDESMLTGEAEPVAKSPGDELLSGSWVVAGTGRHVAAVVGENAYGRRLAAEGRRFVLAPSELRAGIDTILRGVTWVLVPTAVLLVISQLVQANDLHEAIRASVAGVVNMVPEGFVLLTSTALAVGIIRLGRRMVLVQELGALEGLARADILCIDKTGTLTENELEVVAVERLLEDDLDVDAVLAGLAASDPDPNASLQAIARAKPGVAWDVAWRVPFSSAARWSSIAPAGGSGAWALGAPDVLLPWAEKQYGDVAVYATATVHPHVAAGHRALLLAWYEADSPAVEPESRLRPVAVVALGERVRPDAADTAAWFADQGVTLKVLSGDEPTTVGGIAREVGISGADWPIDARELSADPKALALEVDERNVFGRVGPDEKRRIIAALQTAGHTVAMLGDGVNDVLALKQSDLGVAMGAGASAARNAAQVVLLDSRFAALPAVVGEGRRVIGNIERVGKLFVTKTVYACLLAIAVGVARLPFPFFPRHLTIVSSLTIGIPGFFLALSPSQARAQRGFTGRILRAALPMGAVAASATLLGYALVRDEGLDIRQARTTATFVLFGMGIWVLAIVVRPATHARIAMVAWMLGLFGLLAVFPGFRRSFDLDIPRPIVCMAIVGIITSAGALMEIGWRVANSFAPHRRGAYAGEEST